MITRILVALLLLSTAQSFSSLDITEQSVVEDWQQLNNNLNQLTNLSMVDNDITESSLLKILSHPLPQLTILNFTGQYPRKLNPKILYKIFASPYFPRLKTLDISKTSLDDRAFSFLNDSNLSIKSSLQTLGLNSLNIGRKGFDYLSNINFNGLLKTLNIEDTLLLQKDTVDSLLLMICKFGKNNTCHSQLANFSISGTDISRDGFNNLVTTFNSSSIQYFRLNHLDLHYDKLLNQSFNYTAYQTLASIQFPSLKLLGLTDMDINDNIAAILSKWQTPSLTHISIADNPLSDEGVMSLVSRKRTPNLVGLNIQQTDVSDEIMTYLRMQEFQFKFLNFGRTRISNQGFRELQVMNLTQLQKFVIIDLYLSEDTFLNVLNTIGVPQLKEMMISKMQDLGGFFSRFNWSRFKALQILSISNINLEESIKNFLLQDQVLLPSLYKLTFIDIGMDFENQLLLLNKLPKLFPSLRQINFPSQKVMPFLLKSFSEAQYPEGCQIDLTWIKLRRVGNKFSVRQLKVVIYLLVGTGNLASIQALSSKRALTKLFSIVLEYLQFSELEVFQSYLQLDLMMTKILFEVANIKTLKKLRSFRILYEINAEDFFNFFHPQLMPGIRVLKLHFTVPGDITTSFQDNHLIPFYTYFPNLVHMTFSVLYLDEDSGPTMKKELLEALEYPFLNQIILDDQELQTEDLRSFLSRHSGTLRQLGVVSNFLEKGFLDILINDQIILNKLDISGISFTVKEFSQLGLVTTEYLQYLFMNENGLTDAHIQTMLKSKDGLFFPKLDILSIEQNDIRSQGLEGLLSTRTPNLQLVIMERNINPQFLNTLLKYPNRVKGILANQVDVYSLESGINPESVHHVEILMLKVYSFSESDFQILGSLMFTNLEVSTLFVQNIYSCDVLMNLLRLNRYSHQITTQIKNDRQGLNSSCLSSWINYTTTISEFIIIDQYGTTYIPEYIELVTNTKRSINILILSNTRLSPSSLRTILSRNLKDIKVLDLERNYLDDSTFKKVLKNHLQHLQYLSLKSTIITDETVISLSKQTLSSLQFLDLSENFLGDLGVAATTNISDTLAVLQLNNCRLTDSALIMFKNSKFKNLQALSLNNNDFSEGGLVDFATGLVKSSMPQLAGIQLKGISLSKDNYELIQKVLNGKGVFVELNKPYNIPTPNAAQY